MPLITGEKAKTKKNFSTNVAREIQAGKPKNMALAIAFSEAQQGNKRQKKRIKRNG